MLEHFEIYIFMQQRSTFMSDTKSIQKPRTEAENITNPTSLIYYAPEISTNMDISFLNISNI